MTDQIEKVQNDVTDIKVELAKLPQKLTEKLDSRYANKKTEKNVDRLMWLVITAVVVSGLAIIIK